MKTGSLLPVSAGSNGDHGHRDGLVGALRVRDGTAARSRVRQWGGGGGARCSCGCARRQFSLWKSLLFDLDLGICHYNAIYVVLSSIILA